VSCFSWSRFSGTSCRALWDFVRGAEGRWVWRSLYLRRWLFGPRGRGLDYGAYREAALLCRHLQQGRAGQFRVKTVRPPSDQQHTAVLMLAWVGAGGVGGCPGAVLGTSGGRVQRWAAPTGDPAALPVLAWSHALPPGPVTALATDMPQQVTNFG
jgi:hypothetical protein